MLGPSLSPLPRSLALVSALFALPLFACGDDGGGNTPDAGPGPDSGPDGSLDDYLPPLPEPTGEPQSVFAGQVSEADELIEGPAQSGIVGDYYIRNSAAAFIIQSPTRVIGVVPQGGNLVDAVALDESGAPIAGDHFGELSLIYTLGRTCEHTSVEVLQDGSGGGAAVIRATGKTGNNDFINLHGTGLLALLSPPPTLTPQNPATDDGLDCATTYVLYPDSPTLEVTWTLFNGGDMDVRGPMGAFNDTGGNIEVFSPGVGFRRIGINNILDSTGPAPVPYSVYQGPGVAYGVMPVHDDASTPNASFLVAGVSIILFGADELLDILSEDGFFLELPPGAGVNRAINISIGRDAADVEAIYRARLGEATATLEGTVTWESGDPGAGVRVGIFADTDASGDISADDDIVTYADTNSDGTYSASVVPGNYLVRAEVQDLARSTTASVEVTSSGSSPTDLALPDPAVLNYEITDAGNFIPAKITVIGRHPAFPDERLFSTYDREFGVIRMVQSIHGTTTPIADEAVDQPLVLPQGGPYKIIATRGTEWSVDAIVVDDTANVATPLLFTLSRVANADGYVASEYHVHSIASPDAPVLQTTRVATAIADGVEVFASTDHDFIADIQPVIEAMGVADLVRNIPGLEITTFAYGHFNAYPLVPDPSSANFGAVDWARTDSGYAMLPGEIFDAARARGAEVVQVNHPRSAGGLTNFMQYFDRTGMSIDYDLRAVVTDPAKQPVTNEALLLPPGESLFDPDFNVLEVWNGFDVDDINSDGVRELVRLDLVMADWFNFLSLGMQITPVGDSDTHTIIADPMGMPRTYVRVLDDSPQALEDGSVVAQVIDTLAGRNDTARDVIVTDGPFIEVTAGSNDSVIGDTLDGQSGSVTLDITVTSAGWADIDTIEVFANNTPPIGSEALDMGWVPLPVACFTDREGTPAPNDPCANAPIFQNDLAVSRPPLGTAGQIRATVQVTIPASMIPTREGATGDDAWLVVRARGDRGIFPVLLKSAINDSNLDTLVSGNAAEIDAALTGAGVPAMAFTAPIYVDFDGGGYVAPFSPQ